MDRDTQRPSRKARFAPKLRQACDDANQRLLCRVLCVARIVQHAQRDRVHRPFEPADESLDRPLVTADRLRHPRVGDFREILRHLPV